MLNLKSVTYQNIMSVGNHPITLDLTRNHTTLIGGQNGSGKSTALLALVYGLTGKLLNNMKLEQAINSVNKKALLVKVDFEVNGSDWQVVRGEKPKKFEIYKDGEKLDQYANARDQQAFLDLVLGMDFKLLTQLVAINKERYVPFMEMGAAERRKIVEDILNISVFTEMNSVLKDDVKELTRIVAKKGTERSVLITKIEGVQNLVAQLQSSIEESSSALQNEYDEKSELIISLNQQVEELEGQIDESYTKQLELVSKQLKEYDKLGSQFESNIKQHQKECDFFLNNEHCPTCEQSITTELKVQKQAEAQEKISEVESTMVEMIVEVESLSSQYDELESKVAETHALKQRVREIKTQLNFEHSELKKIVNKLNQLKESNDQQTLDDQINLYEKLIGEKDELEAELIELETVDVLHAQMRDLLKDDGVKSLIVKDYNTVMNKKINEYLAAMGFFINITIDENFNEKFHSMNKESFSYANLSTGQKTRLNLAITLALLEVASIKNSAVCNLLWLDEALENLDAEGVSDVMNLFKEKLFAKNIFVVSQRYDEFIDQFHSSIRFKLNSGFTEMER